MNAEPDYIKAHQWSSMHRENLAQSAVCGCFYCLSTFSPLSIKDWIDGQLGETAICPKCGIDSVIGSASGYPITMEFLQKMHEYWFSMPQN